MVLVAITSKEPTQVGSHTNTTRRPLLPSDSDNAAPRLPKGCEVSSRYIISTASASSKRCASPAFSRKAGMTPVQEASSAVKMRAQSVERGQIVGARVNTLDLLRFAGQLTAPSQKGLLTCTRSLPVSFQGQSFSIQVSKAKPAVNVQRAATPERRKHGPSGVGQVSSSYTSASYEEEEEDSSCTDQRGTFAGNVVRRSLHDSIMSAASSDHPDSQRNPIPVPTVQSDSPPDAESLIMSSSPSPFPKLLDLSTKSSSPNKGVFNSRCRRQPSSPVYRTGQYASSSSSPSSKIAVISTVRGGASPSRVRSTVAGILSSAIASNTPSIWSSAADLRRRGGVAESRIVDAHGLRILYNRFLQWRFVNARAESSLNAQEAGAVRSLYGTWIIISKLRKSVRAKRLELQLQQQNRKLASILRGQISCLGAWESMDQDFSVSLSGATESLRASTLRLPVVGARVDIQKVRDAVCSAADVMQAIASGMCFLLSKVELLNYTVLELGGVTAKECALLNQSRDVLSAVAALQVKECSLKAYEIELTDRHHRIELRHGKA